MQPNDEDPFATAAAEFQAAIQNYQAETTKQGSTISPSPVASTPIPTNPVQSSGPAPVPNPLRFSRYATYLSRYDHSKFETCRKSDTHIGSATPTSVALAHFAVVLVDLTKTEKALS